MELKKLSNDELVARTKELVKEERAIITKVLHHLWEIKQRRLYAALGFSSLFEYAVRELKYSEPSASRRVSAMYAMHQMPEVESQLQNGELTLTTLAMVESAYRKKPIEEKREVLRTVAGKSKREVEKILSPEKVTEISFYADKTFLEKVEKLKAIMCENDIKKIFERLVDKELKRAETKVGASSTRPKKTVAPEKVGSVAAKAQKVEYKTASRYIPHKLKQEIWQRDQGRCTFIGTLACGALDHPQTKKRCEATHNLHYDHIKPYALDGETTNENLRLLCRGHNLYRAQETFPRTP